MISELNMNDMSSIVTAVLRCVEGVDGEIRGSVIANVLKNIDNSLDSAFEIEKHMMKEIMDDVDKEVHHREDTKINNKEEKVASPMHSKSATGDNKDTDEENGEENDETKVHRVQHSLSVALPLLRSVASIDGHGLPTQIKKVRDLVERILETSMIVRRSIVQESDLLEMLQEDDFISPAISTMAQYDLYVQCMDTLDRAQKDLEERQKLSNETSRLSRRIERHHDLLWLWSHTVMQVIPQLTLFYVKTSALQPNHLVNGYNWLLKYSLDDALRHRGIKKTFCSSITAFLNKAVVAVTPVLSPGASDPNNFFVDDNNTSSTVQSNPMQSPSVLSLCNDLLVNLLKRILSLVKGPSHETSVHPEELNMLVRACIAHKASAPRNQCVQLLMQLWRHPNSLVRHTALKGFDTLCKSRLPEIMKLVGEDQDSGGGGGSSKGQENLRIQQIYHCGYKFVERFN